MLYLATVGSFLFVFKRTVAPLRHFETLTALHESTLEQGLSADARAQAFTQAQENLMSASARRTVVNLVRPLYQQVFVPREPPMVTTVRSEERPLLGETEAPVQPRYTLEQVQALLEAERSRVQK